MWPSAVIIGPVKLKVWIQSPNCDPQRKSCKNNGMDYYRIAVAMMRSVPLTTLVNVEVWLQATREEEQQQQQKKQ